MPLSKEKCEKSTVLQSNSFFRVFWLFKLKKTFGFRKKFWLVDGLAELTEKTKREKWNNYLYWRISDTAINYHSRNGKHIEQLER